MSNACPWRPAPSGAAPAAATPAATFLRARWRDYPRRQPPHNDLSIKSIIFPLLNLGRKGCIFNCLLDCDANHFCEDLHDLPSSFFVNSRFLIIYQ